MTVATFTTIAGDLEATSSRPELIAVAQVIEHADLTITERDKLGAIVKRRLEEFKTR